MATKEVRYDIYCKECKHLDKREYEDPCYDCMTQNWNEDSHKPIFFEERTDSHSKQATK